MSIKWTILADSDEWLAVLMALGAPSPKLTLTEAERTAVKRVRNEIGAMLALMEGGLDHAARNVTAPDGVGK